jgi:hypothetical protein
MTAPRTDLTHCATCLVCESEFTYKRFSKPRLTCSDACRKRRDQHSENRRRSALRERTGRDRPPRPLVEFHRARDRYRALRKAGADREGARWGMGSRLSFRALMARLTGQPIETIQDVARPTALEGKAE